MTEQLNMIFDFVESLRPDIVKNQMDTGLRASGESALSLETRTVGESVIQLVDGSGAFKFQDAPGRGPSRGSATSDIPLWKRIYNWLAFRKYNLTYQDDKGRVRLSFAISNKIHRKGTYIHITGKKTGVVSDLLTDNRMLLLREQISKFYVRNVVSGYLQAFGKN